MISACVVPTMKHGGGGVMVWGCFAGDIVWDLFKIQGTLNQHGYHNILQQYNIPSSLCLMALSSGKIFGPQNVGKAAQHMCPAYVGTPSRLLEKHSASPMIFLQLIWLDNKTNSEIIFLSFTL
jgi:hypothetical protein